METFCLCCSPITPRCVPPSFLTRFSSLTLPPILAKGDFLAQSSPMADHPPLTSDPLAGRAQAEGPAEPFPPPPVRRVAVVEGGLGGLTLTYLLRRRGYAVRAYQSALLPDADVVSERRRQRVFEWQSFAFSPRDASLNRLIAELELGSFVEETVPGFAVFRDGKLSPLRLPWAAPLPFAERLQLLRVWYGRRRPTRLPSLFFADYVQPAWELWTGGSQAPAPGSAFIQKFFGAPHCTLRYGIGQVTEKLFEQGDFFVESAVPRLWMEDDALRGIFVRSLDGKVLRQVEFDAVVLGQTRVYRHTVVHLLLPKLKLPTYTFFVPCKAYPASLVVYTDRLFPKHESETSCLRLQIPTPDGEEARQLALAQVRLLSGEEPLEVVVKDPGHYQAGAGPAAGASGETAQGVFRLERRPTLEEQVAEAYRLLPRIEAFFDARAPVAKQTAPAAQVPAFDAAAADKSSADAEPLAEDCARAPEAPA